MSNQVKNITRGGQITFHNIRMFIQVNKKVTGIALVLFGIFFIIFFYSKVLPGLTLFTVKYAIAKVMSQLPSVISKQFLTLKTWVIVPTYPPVAAYSTWQAYLSHDFEELIQLFINTAFRALLDSLLCTGILTVGFMTWLARRGAKQSESQFVRGSLLSTPEKVTQLIRQQKIASDIEIDGLPLIRDAEVQHFLIHGTTGSGKGQCIAKMLNGIQRRGDRVILYDKGCTFIPPYFSPDQDVILNPFDERCANWDLWEEAIDSPDFENMAESLIPMHGETDPFWVNAARTIFASVAFRMRLDPDRSISKLLKILLTAELADLETYLEGTEAATLVSDKIEKTAISIRSILTTYLKALRFLEGLDQANKRKFSIRQWVQADVDHLTSKETKKNKENKKNKGRWLFISSNAEQHAALRPLISMWLAMASITLLGLTENYQRRIWFIGDEIPSLHKLPQLPETIAEVRKFGGCFLLGMQSFAQLEKIYGRNAAKEIFDLLNTRFFFKSPSSDIAQLVSREIGEQDMEDMRENYSYGANTIRDGISIGKQRLTRPIVTYPEIMQMQNLECFIRLPQNLPVIKMKLIFQKLAAHCPGFIKRSLNEESLFNASAPVNIQEEGMVNAINKKNKINKLNKIKKIREAKKSLSVAIEDIASSDPVIPPILSTHDSSRSIVLGD